MNISTPRTIEQLREAARIQKRLGLYKETPREIPALSWVWTQVYSAGTKNVLGIVLDVIKGRERGNMVRNYVVLTTEGQISRGRENLLLATFTEVREAAGLSLQQDIEECIQDAIKYGPSDGNTLRYADAAAILIAKYNFVYFVPKVNDPCGSELCQSCYHRIGLPNVIATGKW